MATKSTKQSIFWLCNVNYDKSLDGYAWPLHDRTIPETVKTILASSGFYGIPLEEKQTFIKDLLAGKVMIVDGENAKTDDVNKWTTGTYFGDNAYKVNVGKIKMRQVKNGSKVSSWYNRVYRIQHTRILKPTEVQSIVDEFQNINQQTQQQTFIKYLSLCIDDLSDRLTLISNGGYAHSFKLGIRTTGLFTKSDTDKVLQNLSDIMNQACDLVSSCLGYKLMVKDNELTDALMCARLVDETVVNVKETEKTMTCSEFLKKLSTSDILRNKTINIPANNVFSSSFDRAELDDTVVSLDMNNEQVPVEYWLNKEDVFVFAPHYATGNYVYYYKVIVAGKYKTMCDAFGVDHFMDICISQSKQYKGESNE